VSPYRAAVEFAFSLPTGRVHLCAIHPTKTEVNRYGKRTAIIRGKSSAPQSPSTGINTLIPPVKEADMDVRRISPEISHRFLDYIISARRMPSMTISYP
jgi:hypothetical protein